ncbi:MAG: hypothetical protein QOI82_846 [Actinomycetota bacterium]|jgi:hypothetical protein|nr:hypothetical protein [Actinomycetota bacterium]
MRARLPDNPWTAVACAGGLIAVFLVLRLAVVGGPATFVVAGDQYVKAAQAPAELVVGKGSGYDGQFVYRMVLDPFPDTQTGDGITFDSSPYRAQRVVTPTLAWLIDHPTPAGPALSLLAVNVLALLVGAYFAGRLLRRLGGHAAWGALLVVSFATVIPLARDLTEPIAWAATLAGLELWLAGRRPWAALLFTLAVLARETSLLIPAGLGIWAVVQWLRARDRRALLTPAWLLLPLAVEIGWQLHLRSVWGELPVRTGKENVGTPFVGVVRTLVDVTDAKAHPVWEAERLAVLALLVWAAVRLRRSTLPNGVRVAWALSALLALSLGGWTYDVQFLRAVNEAIGLSLLVLLLDRALISRLMVLGASALSLYVAWQYTTVV